MTPGQRKRAHLAYRAASIITTDKVGAGRSVHRLLAFMPRCLTIAFSPRRPDTMTPGGRLALSIAWGTSALAACFGSWLLAVLAFVVGLSVIEEERRGG